MTAPTKEVAALIEEHVGIKSNRTMHVARRLREAGMLPSGGPGRAPELDRADALVLLMGASSGATLETVATATQERLATTPGGADVNGAPLSIPRTAEIALAVFASQASEGDDLGSLKIEIVHGWPEVVFAWNDGVNQRFQASGSLSGHHGSDKGRWATTIPGTAFANLFRSIK